MPQSDDGLTYAPKIEPQERVVRVDGSRIEEVNRVGALSPDPGATLVIDGERHQVMQARAHETGRRWVAGEVDGAPVAGLSDGGMES